MHPLQRPNPGNQEAISPNTVTHGSSMTMFRSNNNAYRYDFDDN